MVDDASTRWVDSMPAAYQRGLVGPVFQPFAQRLAAKVAERRPQRVLELAAGTGILTSEVLTLIPTASVIATDLNDAMVTLGAAQVPQAEWRAADAMSLPWPDAEFDVVACQFGVMFFPDRVAAYREARRVLKPGGAFVFNSWAAVERHDYEFAIVTSMRVLFPEDPPTFLQDLPHSYTDPYTITADLRAAGFDDVTLDTAKVTSEVASVADLAVGYCTGTPLRAQLVARGDLSEISARLAVELTRLLGGPGPLTGSMAAYEVVAASVA